MNNEDNDIPMPEGELRLLVARLGKTPLVFNELRREEMVPLDRPSVRHLVQQVYLAVDHLEELEINDVALNLLEALAKYEAAMALELF
jgi:hypothetical protein